MLPKLRDFFMSDIHQAFFNADEFSTPHQIDDKTMNIIMDNDLLKERKANSLDGTYEGEILFHAKKTDFIEGPAIHQHIRFDGSFYRISDLQDDEGLYTITLTGNRS